MANKRAKKKGTRQPAGWSSAVKRMLKPEHVTRLSDTQVQITLPPCPDFDIEEDETVEVWIPAAAFTKSDKPVYAGSFTIKADTYFERIDTAINGLKEERESLAVDAKVTHFLLTFFTCEIVAKSVISYSKNKGTNRNDLVGTWTTKDIKRSLQDLKIDFSTSNVEKLFSTERALASEMSARSLRDNITHRMKHQHRSAVRNRYEEIMGAMMQFLSVVEKWRSSMPSIAADVASER